GQPAEDKAARRLDLLDERPARRATAILEDDAPGRAEIEGNHLHAKPAGQLLGPRDGSPDLLAANRVHDPLLHSCPRVHQCPPYATQMLRYTRNQSVAL